MTNNFDYISDNELEDLNRVFYSQAYEIVEDLQDSILRLETDPGDEETLKAIKRYIHTLKGDSNSIGLTTIGTLCHRVEDVLSFLMDGSGHVTHNGIDLLLNFVDTINRILIETESGRDGTDIKGIMGRIEGFLREDANSISPSPIPLPQGERIEARETTYTEYQELQIKDALKDGLNVYEIEIVFHQMCQEKGIAAKMVEKRLNGMGEILSSAPDIEGNEIDKAEKVAILFSSNCNQEEIKINTFIMGITGEINVTSYNSTFRHAELVSASNNLSSCETLKRVQGDNKEVFQQHVRSEMLRVEAEKVDTIMNLVGELIIGRSMIDQIAKEVEDSDFAGDISSRLFNANSYMERTVTDIQKGIMKMRMVQINHVFRRFPKMVRELSAEKGKVIRLDILGKETELDKGIVDYIGEPLSHIIRNSIDHGIEDPAYRRSIDKPKEGVLTLKAYHESGQIVVEVSDDGRGIDIEGLKKKAIEKGLLNEDDIRRLSDTDAINLVFLSGLSTSVTISETSGRGVGMDAVKTAVMSMKGSIEVKSSMGMGTRFILRLPLTLAIIKALLFDLGGRLYAVPVSAVSEVIRIMMDDLRTVDGRDILLIRGKIISIIHLRGLFGINGNGNSKRFALILGIEEKRVGILIDQLLGQQELVIKAIDDSYASSGLITGASILGDGRVVLILDAPAIFRKAVEEEKTKTTLPFIPSRQGSGDKSVPSPLVGESNPILPSPLVGEG
jgi:two-component system chemotaxis sensor kinase CheA